MKRKYILLFLCLLCFFLTSCSKNKEYTITINFGIIEDKMVIKEYKTVNKIFKFPYEEFDEVLYTYQVKDYFDDYNKRYYIDQEIKVSKNLTFNASFKKVDKEFVVKYFDGDVEYINLMNIIKHQDLDYKLPYVVKEHYTFNGWYIDDENNLVENLHDIKSDLNLYASFTPNKYYIQLDYLGFKENEEILYEYNKEYILPTFDTLGYDFMGWSNGKEVITSLKGDELDISLKIVMNPTVYKLNLNTNGGTLDNIYDTYTILDTSLPTPSLDGYIFKGWYKETSYETKVESLDNIYSDISLYALWEEIPSKVTLTLDLNGGTISNELDKYYAYNELVGLPYVSKEGYAFLGFSYSNESNETFNIFNIVKDTTLYARFIPLEEIFVNSIGRTLSKNIEVDVYYEDTNLLINIDSKDKSIINNNGIINFKHSYQKVCIDMIVTYMNVALVYGEEVSILPVRYDDLDSSSVFGYLYSGSMYHFGFLNFDNLFTKNALDTLDVVYYGFATVDEYGHLDLNKDLFFERLNLALSLRGYGIRVVLCIGSNPANFSKMALTDQSIDIFTDEVIECVLKYNFDGVDIDFEFPGVGTGNSVEVDRPNLTKVIKTLREKLDKNNHLDATPYLLTSAIPPTSWGSDRYEIGILNDYLDYINMMSYDLNNTSLACHHTSLYTSKDARAYGFSVDYGVKRFVSKGFSKEKIIIGIAFYGKYYINATTLGGSATYSKNIVYTKIRSDYLNKRGYIDYFDEVACASYILNTTTKEFISYDSERSIKLKCEYAISNKLGGVMFWDYSEDTSHTLINAIKEGMNK